MVIKCKNWKPSPKPLHGICKAGKLGGEPVVSACIDVCGQCQNSSEDFRNYLSSRFGTGKMAADNKKVIIESQPQRHRAWHKDVFYRGDGTTVDLVDLFHGQSVFLICNGPSIKDIDLEKLTSTPGVMTMSLNNGGHKIRTNLWTGQDPPYRFMQSIWEDPSIMKFTLYDYRKRPVWDRKKGGYSDLKLWQCPNTFFHKRHSDFDAKKWLDEDKVVWGEPKDAGGNRSVMLAALHILYFLGFRNVFLLGADFHMTSDDKYFFEDRAAVKHNNRLFKNVAKYLEQLKPYLNEVGFRVFNCSPASHLKVFEHKSIHDAVEMCRVNISQSTEGMYVKR
ncbi:hypothetical protein STSP2_01108 [Anaerohalosphaera lusitana]|uniref:Uncharacterized protein n=1 Tax=Anaerohalosphaera lusitana TaxID=1936003 RepID=A0A1U9NKA8_9BACT|nr:hypothetical protein [Anaerohalosphaera lusitana]AQT67956.1 hypothetical protein STSP2_01108 [Anaerohalosphaera lusitana]